MRPNLARLARMLSLTLVATLVVSAAAQDSAGRRPSSSSTTRTVTIADVEVTRARDTSTDTTGTSTLRQAPRVVVRGELRLCGGEPLPSTLFTSETALCVEQNLPGVTAGQVREKSLDVTGINVTFAGLEVDQAYISNPSLFTTGTADGRGLFDWINLGQEDMPEQNVPDDDEDVFARFELDVKGLGLLMESSKTSGTLESVVKIQPAGRYYYEIVWFELSLTVPTFYSGAVNTIVEKGERLDTPSAEVEEQIDDLVSGSAVFFPCTNFLGAIRCEEEGISV